MRAHHCWVLTITLVLFSVGTIALPAPSSFADNENCDPVSIDCQYESDTGGNQNCGVASANCQYYSHGSGGNQNCGVVAANCQYYSHGSGGNQNCGAVEANCQYHSGGHGVDQAGQREGDEGGDGDGEGGAYDDPLPEDGLAPDAPDGPAGGQDRGIAPGDSGVASPATHRLGPDGKGHRWSLPWPSVLGSPVIMMVVTGHEEVVTGHEEVVTGHEDSVATESADAPTTAPRP